MQQYCTCKQLIQWSGNVTSVWRISRPLWLHPFCLTDEMWWRIFTSSLNFLCDLLFWTYKSKWDRRMVPFQRSCIEGCVIKFKTWMYCWSIYVWNIKCCVSDIFCCTVCIYDCFFSCAIYIFCRLWLFLSLQCFDTVGWVTGRASNLKKVLVCWWWWFCWSCVHFRVPVVATATASSPAAETQDSLTFWQHQMSLPSFSWKLGFKMNVFIFLTFPFSR